MTAVLTEPPPVKRPTSGGLPARRAAVRWAVRVYRREWRRQILIVILLAVAVAGSAFGACATYNIADTSDGTFGSARHLMKFEGSDTTELASRIAAAHAWFGTTDEIGHRYSNVPGLFDPVDIRAQDPDGAYGGPMLAVVSGRYPTDANEIAVTEKVAGLLAAGIGTQITLDDRSRTVVGLVENPNNLDDEFALVDYAHADPPQSVTVLVGGTAEGLESFRDTISGSVVRESRQDLSRTSMALIVTAATAVGLLLVSLVAAAGFVVAAQRRMRQLGMLAAIGATRRHLRLVMLCNGAVVGAASAIVGTVLGVAVWLAVAGYVEVSAGHRIDRFELPWTVLAVGIGLSVATAIAAAWWPARVVARTPIMVALSARPPRPRPARRSAILATILLATGTTATYAGKGTKPTLITAGVLITTIGMLFLGPLAIRVLASIRAHLPVPVRLALTDLVRYQARSGAALAAISLALAISTGIVVGTASADYTTRRDSGLGNLANNQLIVRIGQPQPIMPERTPSETAALQQTADAIVAGLGGTSSVIGLDMAVVSAYTDSGPKGQSGHPVVELGIPTTDPHVDQAFAMFVATPEILALYGLSPSTITPEIDVLSIHSGRLKINNIPERNVIAKTQHLTKLDYSSLPSTLVTTAAMGRHGWQARPVGWLVQADHPLTTQQLSTVQTLAASGGLTIEFHQERASLSALQGGATGAGALLALAVLASTVGLIRGEAANDLRSLTAMGAPRRIRRSLTAATAGALALLGALVGTACSYLVLVAVFQRDLAGIAHPPVAYLAATVVGVPVLATLAAWLLAGREPIAFARRGLD